MKRLLLSIFMLVLLCTGCTKSDNRTVIKFASWGSQSEVEIIKPILSEFEKENPNLKVEFMHIPQNYFQKIHLLIASNLAPDVIFINNLYLPVYADFLEDLTQYSDKNIFFEQTLQALSFDGKVLALPRDASNMVVYYNKTIFDKYKIPYPHKNWTLDDLLKISLQFKKHNIFGISFDEQPLFYLPYLMSNGGGILSDDLKSVIINNPDSQCGLKFYADLRNKYNVAPKKFQSASLTMAQMFLQQKLAMQVSGRWLVPKYREAADFNWDIINFPNGKLGSIVPMDASGWAVSKASKNKQHAIKLIQFLSNKENIQKMTSSGLITPARIDVAKSKTFLDGKPKSSRVFIDVIYTSKPTPVSKNYRELTDELSQKLEPLFNN
ncbi:sugar ABC transporter substrate-binding protein [bacterium]|nr:sugar ABC transporter substrate-binding protein [bacterium]